MKIIIISMVALLSSCQTFDNLAYKYGNGVMNAINGANTAIACVASGGTICTTTGAISGYIKGKQEARSKITASNNARLIKKLAEKKQGLECKSWFGWGCDE